MIIDHLDLFVVLEVGGQLDTLIICPHLLLVSTLLLSANLINPDCKLDMITLIKRTVVVVPLFYGNRNTNNSTEPDSLMGCF